MSLVIVVFQSERDDFWISLAFRKTLQISIEFWFDLYARLGLYWLNQLLQTAKNLLKTANKEL